MAGFKGTLNDISFDGKIARKLLEAKSFEIVKAAIIEWINVAEQIIPIWSGESRGTLIAVGELVGHQVSGIGTTSGLRKPPNRWRDGEKQTRTSLVFKRAKWTFLYQHQVPQLEVNEDHDARQWGFRLINPGPYNFINQANEAFDARIREELSKFSVRAFFLRNLKITKVKING